MDPMGYWRIVVSVFTSVIWESTGSILEIIDIISGNQSPTQPTHDELSSDQNPFLDNKRAMQAFGVREDQCHFTSSFFV